MSATEDRLYQLEVSLWVSESRGDRGHMESVLAEGFVEFGRSGRRYSRADVLSVPVDSEIDVVLPLADFAVRLVVDGLALVTYRSELRHGAECEVANRSSLWRETTDGEWLLEFHQGTPVDT
jgi:hypothetical protein